MWWSAARRLKQLGAVCPGHQSARLAVVRLRGRSTDTCNVKGSMVASDRFKYDYADETLAALVA